MASETAVVPSQCQSCSYPGRISDSSLSESPMVAHPEPKMSYRHGVRDTAVPDLVVGDSMRPLRCPCFAPFPGDPR